ASNIAWARPSSCRGESSGKTARMLSATARRVSPISRHASHITTLPMAYDTLRGRAPTKRSVAPKMVPLLRPCSVHRRGRMSRSAAVTSSDVLAGSDAFEKAIVHRQKTGARRIAHRSKLAALAVVDGGDRHGGDAAAAPPDLHEHFGLDLVAGRPQLQRPQRVDAKHSKPALRVAHRHADEP